MRLRDGLSDERRRLMGKVRLAICKYRMGGAG